MFSSEFSSTFPILVRASSSFVSVFSPSIFSKYLANVSVQVVI